MGTPAFRTTPALSEVLADLAVGALIDEAQLTPKPGLVDRRGSGAHLDLDLSLMIRSAKALRSGFAAMSEAAIEQQPNLGLRETLGDLGRKAEHVMMAETGGVNTHRGAIWALGLLCAGAAMQSSGWKTGCKASQVAKRAAELANLPDRFCNPAGNKGAVACSRYRVTGARGEAQQAFPRVIEVGLPALRRSRDAGHSEQTARLNALIAIISRLDDTCILSRAGDVSLSEIQGLASRVVEAGGIATLEGRRELNRLEHCMLAHNASPGGAADLLAATLFLDAIEQL